MDANGSGKARLGKHRGKIRLVACTVFFVEAAGGCLFVNPFARFSEPIGRVVVANPRFGSMTVAVAPALNLSGSSDFDPNQFADLMASELSYAEGISVIPVSRVLGVLAAQGKEGVGSPAQALALAGSVGADAILVFAVTEYDPYDSPIIGISAQLYGTRPRTGVGAVDPVSLARDASSRQSAGANGDERVLAQTQAVFDASHNAVVRQIKMFARRRSGDRGSYGWRKIVVDQRQFIRFCCNATIVALFHSQEESAPAADLRER